MTDLDWLFARQRFGIHPGLSRVRALLARLGDPQQAFQTVLVGGTNGKGSTAASLAAMLVASGERTGLFTSPHLTRFSERFVVNGQELPEATVLAALRELRPAAEAVEASFFEVVTALGCLLFARAGVGTAVMEVGLGGRLDATNALEPVLSVLTNVGLDHTEVLGETREAVAREKAGILRRGRPAVTGVAPDLLPILEASGAELWSLNRDLLYEARPLGWDGWALSLETPRGELTFRTPLLGPHGAANAVLAAAAAVRLGLPEGAIQAGAAETVWPGRLERAFWQGRELLLDGAHNPDGARALAETLRGLGESRLPVVFGVASDKAVGEMARALAPLASEVLLTRAVLSPRAADPQTLVPLFPGVPVRVAATPAQALAALPSSRRAVVCGSLYLIGEVRALVLGEAPEDRERWQ